MNATKTKVLKVTYLGRRAEVKIIPLGGGKQEKRTRWIDDADAKNGGWAAGTITSEVSRGNALKGAFVVLTAAHAVDVF